MNMKPNSHDLKDVYMEQTNTQNNTQPDFQQQHTDLIKDDNDNVTAKDVESKNKEGDVTPITPMIQLDKFDIEQNNLLVGKETLD